MAAAARESVRVKSNHKSIEIDSPEFDDFFRRGDEPAHGPDTLQPVVDIAHEDEADRQALRTPAQVARRAKFIKLVSLTMAFLTLGSASAFTYKAVQGHRPTVSFSARSVVQMGSDSAVAAQALHEVAHPSSPVAEPIAAVAEAIPVRPSLPAVSEPEQTSDGILKPDSRAHEPKAPEPVVAKEPPKAASAASAPAVAAANSTAVSQKSEAKPSAAKSQGSAKSVVAVPLVVAKPAVKVASPVSGRARSVAPKLTVVKKVGPKPADYRPPTASFSD